MSAVGKSIHCLLIVGLVAAGCSPTLALDRQTWAGTIPEEAIQVIVGDVVVEFPGGVAEPGTGATVELEDGPSAMGALMSMSRGVKVSLEGGQQPDEPITISVPIALPTSVESADELLVFARGESDGAFRYYSGAFDTGTGRFTFDVDHLSTFGLFGLDLGAVWDEARTAVMHGLGLERPAPECEGESAHLGGRSYSVASTPQTYLCVSERGGNLVVQAFPNGPIPFTARSAPESRVTSEVTDGSVATAAVVAVARALGLLGEGGTGAVFPGVRSSLVFSGAPSEAVIGLSQYPALFLLSILATTVDTILGVIPGQNSIMDALGGLECMGAVVESGQEFGASIDGETVASIMQAFFGCVGILGGDILGGPAKIIIAILASGPAFLVAGVIGIVNEFTGQDRYVVEVTVTADAMPVVPSAAALIEAGFCGPGGEITGHTAFTHPTWGPSEFLTCLDLENRELQGLAVVDGRGVIRWGYQIHGGYYELGVPDPGVDASGNLFVLYDPGRYRSVAVFRPAPDTMSRLAGFYSYGDDGEDERFYYSELVGPDSDGLYAINAYNNDCEPDCAGGTITSTLYKWDGTDYSA